MGLGPVGQRGSPSSSTSSIISCSSSGVGFWPSILITLPSSLVLMQPSSAPSTKMSKAALNSVSDGGGVGSTVARAQQPGPQKARPLWPICPLPSEPLRSQREGPQPLFSSLGSSCSHSPALLFPYMYVGVLTIFLLFCQLLYLERKRGLRTQAPGFSCC